MCDTLGMIKNGWGYFAKNSDRSPNEIQVLEYYPARTGLSGQLDVTYTSLPQAAETHAVLLSRPAWMWGAEMGVNDCGICIGNEAVFTRGKYGKTGLTGGLVNQAGNEDYANYYASQSLLHTNNLAKDTGGNFIKINNARVAIRRYIKSVQGENSTTYGQTTIAYSVGPPGSGQQAYIVVDKYMTNADTIERTEETNSSP